MTRMIVACLAALLALAAFVPACAQTPTTADLVRWIYLSQSAPGAAETKGLAFLSAPAQRRQFFSARMADFFDANDSHGNDLAAACIDFGLDIPGQDFDPAEIARSLTVSLAEEPGAQVVTARFTNFGQAAQVAYTFVPVGGGWRIDDIAGPGYRASEIPCTPATEAPPPPAAATPSSYCYASNNDRIRLDVSAAGDARFSFESWQGGGHSCGGEGVAHPAGDRWIFAQLLGDRPCRMEIVPTADGGLRLTDTDHACKSYWCGARAAIDGLTFPGTARVDCAALPAQ